MSDHDNRQKFAHKQADRNFTFHTTTETEQVAKMAKLRESFGELAHAVIDLVPEGRERSLALTHLEEGCMQAIAGIVRPPAGP